jgi:hypothetical protein
MQKPCHNLQFSVIRFAESLSKTTQKGLGKDEQGCPTMRQFAVFAAQFADFVVTLQQQLIKIAYPAIGRQKS